MPYCTQAHLVDRFGLAELIQLTNPDDREAETVSAGPVADGIADIDALIDAKLQARFSLPLPSVPRVLRNIACDLVRARLYQDRITDHVAKREAAAMKLLDEIKAGTLQLGLDDAGQAARSTDGPQFTETTRVFSPTTLRDYAP